MEMQEKSARLLKGETVPLPKFKWLRDGIYHIVATAPVAHVRKDQSWVRLTFDRERCTYPECQLCVDNCPGDAIDLSGETAIIQGKGCLRLCGFCETICPTGAISYPEGYLPKLFQYFWNIVHKGEYPKWYARAELELLDNRGTLYRRLGAEVSIDDPERAAYKVHPKRPRLTLPDVSK
jgi:ferredoxin